MTSTKMNLPKTEKAGLAVSLVAALLLAGCYSSTDKAGAYEQPPQALPVITATIVPATTYQEFSASIEGSKDIEIRPQVNGYLDKIFIDEGAYVKKGQPLFHINDLPYKELLNTANASLAAAKANLANAQINLAKITPLVQNNVVSDVQLKASQAAYDAAAASVSQAQATVQGAQINLGYTLIKAPVDGYIGRIPFKTGSLVGLNTAEALTLISEIKEVYAYFSMSESDFIQFKNQFTGKNIEEKLKQLPPVELVLPDNSIFAQKGKVQTVSGQFSNTMGSISFRAAFPNGDGLLRSGNTGTIRIPQKVDSSIVVPQEATFELQDKVFVYVVGDSNKVTGTPISVAGRSGNYYLVRHGLKPGARIVYSGHDRLRDGVIILPESISLDSLLRVRPL